MGDSSRQRFSKTLWVQVNRESHRRNTNPKRKRGLFVSIRNPASQTKGQPGIAPARHQPEAQARALCLRQEPEAQARVVVPPAFGSPPRPRIGLVCNLSVPMEPRVANERSTGNRSGETPTRSASEGSLFPSGTPHRHREVNRESLRRDTNPKRKQGSSCRPRSVRPLARASG